MGKASVVAKGYRLLGRLQRKYRFAGSGQVAGRSQTVLLQLAVAGSQAIEFVDEVVRELSSWSLGRYFDAFGLAGVKPVLAEEVNNLVEFAVGHLYFGFDVLLLFHLDFWCFFQPVHYFGDVLLHLMHVELLIPSEAGTFHCLLFGFISVLYLSLRIENIAL